MDKLMKNAGMASAVLLLMLAGCSSGEKAGENDDEERVEEQGDEQYDREDSNDPYDMHDSEDRKDMDENEEAGSSSADVPDGLMEADDPKFPDGSDVTVKADHMPGMYGAKGKIAGAYATTAYAVTFTPTDGGKPVEGHKWVIHEELEDPEKDPLEKGTQVTIDADHMEGMKGATGIIDSAEQTTVYMIDYTPEDGGEEVKNHKWVTEDELSDE